MQFFLHGKFDPGVAEKLKAAGHQAHTATELARGVSGEPDAADFSDQRDLLVAIAARQWMLLTNQRDLVQQACDQRLPGPAIMVLLVSAGSPAAQSQAIDRLFARYPRLSPGRLYTITPNRVKVRQLPQPRRG
ncbi:MAG: hypothetical protein HKL95_00675 [Phycisphaerae bacterium]|nr:hypothetical protein [Phycisphaerae bacterium]